MGFKPEQVEQLTVFLENRPGMLADLCAHLADRGISMRAMAVLDNTDSGTVRMVVDDPEAAKTELSDAGVAYTTASCLAVEMPNSPAGFAGIARMLSAAGVNIDYIYASGVPNAGTALGVLHVSDVERAMSIDWNG
ncbi:MAG: amino acid-binding protein [bacterium]|nr:amino acid-binding protein [bacterium]